MAGFTLYTWGVIPFETYPFSLYEVQHVTETDWARKEIAGAAIYREWVGENDEELHFRGKVFPHFIVSHFRAPALTRRVREQGRSVFGDINAVSQFGQGPPNPTSGGLGHLDVLDQMRRLGQAHTLTRGDGWHMGWYVIQRLMRAHANLGRDGIGQQIEFEVTFQRVPVPSDPLAYFGSMWGALTAG